MKSTRLLGFTVGLIVIFNACLFDKLPEPQVTPPTDDFQVWCDSLNPTFNTVVQPIIAQSCAYDPFCHPSFTNYSTILSRVNGSNALANRVFTLKDNPATGMPPNNSVYPQSVKDDLTQEELDIIQCWLDKGAPE